MLKKMESIAPVFSSVLMFLSTGCYSYVRTEVDNVPLRSEVSAVLSTQGEISIRERVGLRSGEVRGELIDRNSEQILLAVPTVGPFTSTNGEELVQRVDIPRGDVLFMELRQVSPAKTAGLVAVLTGAATAVAVATLTGEKNAGSNPNGPTGPDERLGLKLPFLLKVR